MLCPFVYPVETIQFYTMVWIIQLCIAAYRGIAPAARWIAVRAGLYYVDLCVGWGQLTRWCRRRWADRYHIIDQLQLYLMAFLLIRREPKPPAYVEWASVTMQEYTMDGIIHHTREFTNPIREFYDSADNFYASTFCRWVYGIESSAVSVQLITSINGSHMRLSSIDLQSDVELHTGRGLVPDEEGMPCVLLSSLPGIDIKTVS